MEKYDKYFKKYDKYFKIWNQDDNWNGLDTDNGDLHILQDKICKKFILDIAHNKLSTEEIKLLSLKIEKNIFNGPKINLWYA